MAVSIGGQQAFADRVNRIAKTEGQTKMFIGLDETCQIGASRGRRARRRGFMRYGIFAAIMVMPAAAYAQGLVDVTPDQAMDILNLVMDKAIAFINS